jgi:hypothetical protein
MKKISSVYFCLLIFTLQNARAACRTLNADPSNYTSQLASLLPCDTLLLAPGNYGVLSISSKFGLPGSPITIKGPDSGPLPIFHNPTNHTIRISNSAFIVLKNFEVNGGNTGNSGVVAEGTYTHDITLDNLKIYGVGDVQQTVGISTTRSGITWNWTIRNCWVDQAGTGAYLGNSSFGNPFVNGIIENNLFTNTIGYNMEIKAQDPYSAPTALSGDSGFNWSNVPHKTIVRNNVFIKDSRPSPDGERPNLLIGRFPGSGPGMNDMYEIYGNFFYYNLNQMLLQATGRFSIHDNIFVQPVQSNPYGAIAIREHDGGFVNIAHVYSNTIYGGGVGIYFGSLSVTPTSAITKGNLIFTGTPYQNQLGSVSDNITGSVASAANYLLNPNFTLGSMDFYPKAGSAAKGAALDLSPFASNLDYNKDFNGTSKGSFLYRGAYAGEGTNPGWRLNATKKSMGQDVTRPKAPGGLRVQ